MPKAQARAILRRFVGSGIVRLEPHAAFDAREVAAGAGLVDGLIHLRYRSLGAITLTLERRQGSLEGAVRLRGG